MLAVLALFLPVRLAVADATPPPPSDSVKPSERIHPAVEPVQADAPATKADPVVQVNVTFQAYDFLRPWAKKSPGTRSGVGAVIDGGRVLVTAELVANQSFVEIELPETGEKSPAHVVVADYSANLALVEPDTDGFLDGLGFLEVNGPAQIGDVYEAWQIEINGSLLRTDALLTAVQVQAYPNGDQALLLYQLTSALQSRDGSFTLPLVHDGRLAGVIMRFDVRSQNMSAIPAEVVTHFLEDLSDGTYEGFPKVGIGYSSTRDPQLRAYAGLDPKNGGVYINYIQPGSPGAEAGIERGDVLLEVAGRRIDQDGNYQDAQYGRIALANLVSLLAQSGESVPFVVHRGGERRDIDVIVRAEPASASVSPPYVIDEAPDFLVVGGLVFQELSRQYLMEWGNNWPERANPKLIYYDRYQKELFPEGNRRIVFLSQVLPTPATLGYQDLGQPVVTRVNNRKILSLRDLDAALKSPIDGFHKIEMEDHPKLLFMDAAEAENTNQALMRIYGLAAVRRISGDGLPPAPENSKRPAVQDAAEAP